MTEIEISQSKDPCYNPRYTLHLCFLVQVLNYSVPPFCFLYEMSDHIKHTAQSLLRGSYEIVFLKNTCQLCLVLSQGHLEISFTQKEIVALLEIAHFKNFGLSEAVEKKSSSRRNWGFTRGTCMAVENLLQILSWECIAAVTASQGSKARDSSHQQSQKSALKSLHMSTLCIQVLFIAPCSLFT